MSRDIAFQSSPPLGGRPLDGAGTAGYTRDPIARASSSHPDQGSSFDDIRQVQLKLVTAMATIGSELRLVKERQARDVADLRQQVKDLACYVHEGVDGKFMVLQEQVRRVDLNQAHEERRRGEIGPEPSSKGTVAAPEEDSASRPALAGKDVKDEEERAGDTAPTERPPLAKDGSWDEGTLSTLRTISSMTVHDKCTIYATTPSTNSCGAVAVAAASLLFVLVQLFLLASIVLESSFSRCVSHDDCATGEWCSPALAGRFSTSPGVCFDCWSAKMFSEARFFNASYETSPDPYERMAEAAGDAWLRAGAEHCAETDTYPRRCDALVHSFRTTSPLSMFVFSCVVLMLVGPLVDDLDEAETVVRLMRLRSTFMPAHMRRYLAWILLWLSTVLRRYALPMLYVGAALSLMLKETFTAKNLLLDGLALIFVAELDDTFGSVFLRSPSGGEDGTPYVLPKPLWLLNRLYGASLVVVFFLTMFRAEAMLSIHGNEAKYGSVCSDIREIVTVYSFLVCAVFAIINPFVDTAVKLFDKNEAIWNQRLRRGYVARYSQIRGFGPKRAERLYQAQIVVTFLCKLFIVPFVTERIRNAFVAQGPLVMLQIADGLKLA